MACTRGCEGVSICNALGLCCIQFLQECGKECDGVAEGYSTIQFDDAGNLVVCSNVGGVCECSQCCVTEIAFDNTCDDGGVGTDYALWEADLTDGVLTLNGAPEHTSMTDAAFEILNIPGNPHPGNPGGPGTFTEVEQANAVLTITNPSDCREMAIRLNSYGVSDIQDYVPPLRVQLVVRMTRDARTVNRGGIAFYFNDSLDNPLISGANGSGAGFDTLLPGETVTYEATTYIRNFSNVPIPTIFSTAIIWIFGSTI